MDKEEHRLRETFRQERNSAILLGSAAILSGGTRIGIEMIKPYENPDLIPGAKLGLDIGFGLSAPLALISVGLMMRAKQKLNAFHGPK